MPVLCMGIIHYDFDHILYQSLVPYLHQLLLVHVLMLDTKTVALLAIVLEVLQLVAVI